jgi:DNA-binding transcriptional ArsR family regulator
MSAAVHVIDDVERATAVLHPLRQRVLRELLEPESATSLSRRIGLPRQQLNYHLRLLEEEGLVEAVGERQRRGCTERLLRAVARSYVISPAALGELATDPAHVQDRASSAYLVAVAARTMREVAEQRERAEGRGQLLPTLTLETDIQFATPQSQQAFAQELTELVAGLIAKHHDETASGGRRFRLMTGVYPAASANTGQELAARKRSRTITSKRNRKRAGDHP